MSTTQQRLEAYQEAELRILKRGQSQRFEQRQLDQAELAEIRKAITALETQLQRERTTTAGRSSLRYATVSFGDDR